MKNDIFTGTPNGQYNSIDELFQKNKTLLLYYLEDNKYRIIQKFKTPNKCLLIYRQLQKDSLEINKFKMHTII